MSGKGPSRVFPRIGAFASLWFNNACYLLVGMDDTYYYSVKAHALSRLDDFPGAIECLRKALQQGESSYPRAQMAWCYYMMGDFEKALDNYRISYSRNKRAIVALGFASAALQCKQVDEARALLAEVRGSYEALNRHDQASFATLVECANRQSEPDEALSHVACPKCKRSPRLHHRWLCCCGNHWNTFTTRGCCPACSFQWSETVCPDCGKLSLHADWYL